MRLASIAPDPRAARWFVWTVWAGMVAIALWHFAHYGRNLPLAEDWEMVAPMTGHQPDLGAWLWSQNNEHRLPLPRLVLLGVLKLTGDFRAGMLVNLAAIAILAGVMIELARRLRQGRTRYTDAFFPLLLLEVGNWQNLFWAWQLSFVLSVVVACLGLLAIVRRPRLDTRGAALAMGAALLLAPLCGGTGLIYLPPLLLYAGWQGVRMTRMTPGPRRPAMAPILLASVGLTLVLGVWYFVGYHRPTWIPPNPGLGESLVTAIQFQAYGLGPAVRTSWTFWSITAILLLLTATARVVAGLRPAHARITQAEHPGDERQRAWGLLAGLLSVAGVAAAMGYGRAAVLGVYGGWPDRYVLLAAPAFCLAYFAWELPGTRWRGLAQATLFVLAALLLPLNTAFGREWGKWYVGGMNRVIRDIDAGVPEAVLAERHREFLIHFWDAHRLRTHMRMLREAGVGPFRAMNITPDTASPNRPLDSLTLRYQLAEAGAVDLVWGIDGWHRVPASIRDSGTTFARQGDAMVTPMRRAGDAFIATLRFPRGSTLDYGFMITARRDQDSLSPLWDGDRRKVGVFDGAVVEEKPGISLLANPLQNQDTLLVQETISYGPTDARKVRLVWGIDGWQRLPSQLFPPATRVTRFFMTTTMRRVGSHYTVVVPVPAGRRLDFAFQLDRADRFEVNDNNAGRNYSVMARQDSSISVRPNLSIAAGSGLGTVLWTGMVPLVGLAALAGLLSVIAVRMGRMAR